MGLLVTLGFLCAAVPQGRAAVFPASERTWELGTFHGVSSSRILGSRPLGEENDRFVYATIGPPPGTVSGALIGYGVSHRGQEGWLPTSIGFPYEIELTEILTLFAPLLPGAFSDDLQESLWLAAVPLAPGAPPEGETALYRDVAGEPPELISKVIGEPRVIEYPGFAGISGDGSRVVFDTPLHLLAADAGRTEGKSIYAWQGGNLHLVDVNETGELLSTCGARISKSNGMSASGTRIFFSVPASCNGTEKVYLRDLEDGTTTEISASQCTRVDCNAAADVRFAGATHDGRFAYLTTTQQLTDEDHDSLRDLYAYDVASGELRLLSGGASSASGEVVAESIAYPSEDGSRVYFRGSGEVLPGEATTGEKLFVADAGGTHLVAPAQFPFEPQIQLSADGSRALFVTETPVLGSDTDSQGDAYLYDDEAEELTEVSTGPTGGNGAFPVSIDAPSPLNLHEFESGDTRPYWAIDASGDRVIFATEEKLLPEDTNGGFDVYEWHNGELGLVTPGNQPLSSSLAGMSRDGRSVMFATNATLVPSDLDGEGRDLYDARLEGGFPEVEAPPGCNESSCPLPDGQRVTPAVAASMTPLERKRGKLKVLGVGKAKRGAIAVRVSVPSPGQLSGTIWVREGGKKVILASGGGGAIRSGPTRLSLQLTRPGRGLVGVQKAHLTVSAGSAKVSQAVKVRF